MPSAILIALLNRPIPADDKTGIEKRVGELESLFDGLTSDQRVQMSRHLNNPTDPLARLFDCELDTTTRDCLRARLQTPSEAPREVPPEVVPEPPKIPATEAAPESKDIREIVGGDIHGGPVGGARGHVGVKDGPPRKKDGPRRDTRPDDPGRMLERAGDLVEVLLAAGGATAIAAGAAASLAGLLAEANALVGAEFGNVLSILEYVDGRLLPNEKALASLRRRSLPSYESLNTLRVKLEHRGSIDKLERLLQQIEAIERTAQDQIVAFIRTRDNSTRNMLSVLDLEPKWQSPRAGHAVYITKADQLVGEHIALTKYAEAELTGLGWQSHHIVSETHLDLAGIGQSFPDRDHLPCVLLPPTAHLERFHGFLKSASLQGFDRRSSLLHAHRQGYDALGDYTGKGAGAIKREVMSVVKKMLGFTP